MRFGSPWWCRINMRFSSSISHVSGTSPNSMSSGIRRILGSPSSFRAALADAICCHCSICSRTVVLAAGPSGVRLLDGRRASRSREAARLAAHSSAAFSSVSSHCCGGCASASPGSGSAAPSSQGSGGKPSWSPGSCSLATSTKRRRPFITSSITALPFSSSSVITSCSLAILSCSGAHLHSDVPTKTQITETLLSGSTGGSRRATRPGPMKRASGLTVVGPRARLAFKVAFRHTHTHPAVTRLEVNDGPRSRIV